MEEVVSRGGINRTETYFIVALNSCWYSRLSHAMVPRTNFKKIIRPSRCEY
jgi:hypothetical protein